MNTNDEIMAMADAFATAHRFRETSVANARATLKTAIDELVEQAKWAHHNPALLSDADAAADLAGVARPGAEPVKFLQFLSDVVTAAGLVSHGKQCKALGARLSEAAFRYRTAPPQASQPLTDDEIDQMWREATIKPALTSEFVRTFARAVEAAHGIGAAQKGKP